MPEVLEKKEYTVERSPENISFRLIPEETVKDLKRVYLNMRFYCKFKRAMDIILSAMGLALLLVPFAMISLIVYFDDPGPVIFSQYRVGRRGRSFKLYKFRTMKRETPMYLPTMEIYDPDRYITRVGRILRKLSLDELPQLFNVLKGDMSLVGPRPLIADEYEIHVMRMRFGVYSVRPGVTGLAQIHGRDLVSPADKVRWDVKYVQDFGLWEDIKILFATVPKVFGRVGVAEGYRKNSAVENAQESSDGVHTEGMK